MVIYIRVRSHDQGFELGIVSRPDQVFQVDHAIELLILVNDIDRRDIIVLIRLTDEFFHRLLDRQVILHHDEVRGHLRSDLIVLVGLDELDVLGTLIIHQGDDLLLRLFIDFFEYVNSIVGVHVLDDLRSTLDIELGDVLFRIFEVCEDIGSLLGAEDMVQFFTFFFGDELKRIRDVALMVVFEFRTKFSVRLIGTDQRDDLFNYISGISFCFTSGFIFDLIFDLILDLILIHMKPASSCIESSIFMPAIKGSFM